jgi:hypothetical protein
VTRGVRVAARARGTSSGGKLATVGTAAARRAVALSAIRRRRLSETDWVGTVALGRAQIGAPFCNYSNFAPISKYKVKTIPTFKIIETWHGARIDPSKQFLPLGLLPILNRIQVIKFGTTSTLNSSLNF